MIDSINQVVYLPLLKIQSVDPWFFGFNLALTPAKANLWYYYLIPLITGILQYWQAQVSMPATEDKGSGLFDQKNTIQKDKKTTSSNQDEFQKAMSIQMRFLFPFMVGWFSYSLPVGLSLYWNIFSIFSIIQYRKISHKN